jgi:ankyrin repeat protein
MHKLVIIIRILLCIWRSNINDKEAVNFLLSQAANTCIKNGEGKRQVQFAEECINVEIIDCLQSCTLSEEWPSSGTEEETNLNKNEIRKNIFLAKDKFGFTVWHGAALEGNLQALEILWFWAKEEEINTDELLLSQTEDGFTAFHMAAEENHVEILKKLWGWAEERKLIPYELKNKLFLTKDYYGYTAWHRAALSGRLEALESLWVWAKEAVINRDELLLTETGNGLTAFHLAAEGNHIEILKKLWGWAEETKLNPNDLRNKSFLSNGRYGFIAWHMAAIGGSLEALELLWIWAKEVEINTDELLLSQIEDGYTAFHIAAELNRVEVLKKLWGLAEVTKLNSNELRKKLFLAKNIYGNTALQTAVLRSNTEALATLLSCGKEMELNTREFLLGII